MDAVTLHVNLRQTDTRAVIDAISTLNIKSLIFNADDEEEEAVELVVEAAVAHGSNGPAYKGKISISEELVFGYANTALACDGRE